MPEPVEVKCDCGWTADVYPGKILSVICPKCGKKVPVEKPKEKVGYEEILSGSISDAKKEIEKLEKPDYGKLLELEKENKDRKGMKEYLESKGSG